MDFSVWTPWNTRVQKVQRFAAQVFVGSTLQSQQLRGPSTFRGWEDCWAVFRAAAIMTGHASPAELDAYSWGIRSLVDLFPEAWGVIHQADEVMRAEQWAMIHEEPLVTPIPGVSTSKPWGWILRNTAFGSKNVEYLQFWNMRVVLPLTTRNAGAAARKAHELERSSIDVFAIAGGSSSSTDPPRPKAPQSDWVPRPKFQPKAKATPNPWVRAQDTSKGKGKRALPQTEAPEPALTGKRGKKRSRKTSLNTN